MSAFHGVRILGPDGQPVGPTKNRAAWKRERIAKIGSSDAAAILQQDEYTAPETVWDRIVLSEWEDASEGGDIRRGRKQERVAAETFTERTGLVVEECGMVAHPDHPQLVTDLDGLIPRPDEWPEAIKESEVWSSIMETEGPGALELKVPRIPTFYRYKAEGLPRRYIIQHHHHFEVSGCTWGFFAFYTPEYDDLIAFPVVRDPDFGTWLRTAELAWWRDHVVAGKRPKRRPPEPPKWPKPVPGDATPRVDTEWLEQADLVAIRHYELVEAQEAYDETEAALLQLLEDDEQHVSGAGVVVTRKSLSPQRRTDYKAFRAALKAAQAEDDVEALRSLDPNDEAFKYTTNTSEKVEVKVVGPNPLEVMLT